uniref:Ig-like domain-containing protein n=1 Tax=Nothoprocta perdicaria TaxID=30464 RepID=A0A8C6YWN1_NOTPE
AKSGDVGMLLLCPGYVRLALVVPKEVSGRLGEKLSIRCWYPRGYESYPKYWCRGASRDSCHKVAATAEPVTARPRGRLAATDLHVFCVLLLTVERLAEQDAGTYWCGIERLGRDLMEPVTVTVLPGEFSLTTALAEWTLTVSTVANGTEFPNTTSVATQDTRWV